MNYGCSIGWNFITPHVLIWTNGSGTTGLSRLDSTRRLINAACEVHFHRTGCKFSNLDFLLAGKPDAPETTTSGGIRLVLDEAAVERKPPVHSHATVSLALRLVSSSSQRM